MAQLLGKGSALGKTMQFNSNLGILHLLVAGVVSDYVYGNMYGKQAAPVIFYKTERKTNPSISWIGCKRHFSLSSKII
jgi:hypothetical protein